MLDPETRFEFILARELGFGSRATMRRRLSQREFMEWAQFYGWEARERASAQRRAQIKRSGKRR